MSEYEAWDDTCRAPGCGDDAGDDKYCSDRCEEYAAEYRKAMEAHR